MARISFYAVYVHSLHFLNTAYRFMLPPDTVHPQMSRRAPLAIYNTARAYTPVRTTPTTTAVNGKDKSQKPDPSRPRTLAASTGGPGLVS